MGSGDPYGLAGADGFFDVVGSVEIVPAVITANGGRCGWG